MSKVIANDFTQTFCLDIYENSHVIYAYYDMEVLEKKHILITYFCFLTVRACLQYFHACLPYSVCVFQNLEVILDAICAEGSTSDRSLFACF